MFKKVLVLADGDDPGQPALRRALECVADGGEIEVLAVVYEPMLEGYLGNKSIYEPLRKRVLDERRERAAALARAAESHGARGSSKAVWSHPMHAAVAAEVDTGGIDLVVAAPASFHQGNGTLGHGLSHSDWQVVTGCHAPLLVVRSHGRRPYRTIAAAIDPFHAHAKPAELDRDILHYAKAVQARTGASLAAVHCYVPVEYFGADLTRRAATDPQLGDARVEEMRVLCDSAGIPRDSVKVVPGPPHRVLTDMQRTGEADLVVMGALARGRFSELILGNTAERVLHHGTGDVLVITPERPASSSAAARA
jgi:universal stress protein E